MPEFRTGLDLCSISRLEKACGSAHFLERVFTEAERVYARDHGAAGPASLAGMWAAKEAFCKALGTGIAFPLTDVEIVRDAEGAPAYALHGEAARRCGGAALSLSVTHEADMAAAVCLLVRDPEVRHDA